MIFYKFPFNEKIFSIQNNSDHKGMGFYSFDSLQEIIFFGEQQEINTNDLPEMDTDVLPHIKDFQFITKKEYLKTVEEVISFIKENHLQKLVFSRRKILEISNKINLTESYKMLCKSYPNAFVYLFEQGGICWMGAFSELLGKFNKETSEFQTMSLAGTLPITENWTSKEQEEQQTVTDYILEIMKKYDQNVQQSQPYDHFSGNIKHLRTDFRAKIQPEWLNELISELHPTPAVCGIPKEFCKHAINQFERNNREFYSGYIRVETEKEIFYFVNLRCGKFFKNQAHVFVGGGITKESTAEKEWAETELKSEAILKNLVFS